MITLNFVILIAASYGLMLFGIAYYADLRYRRGEGQLLQSPIVYTLSLSVYCTAWTFYGAVGSAVRNGLEFLTIYLGPTLLFIGWWWFLRRLVQTGRSEQVTSIADLISSRYGKSVSLGVVVTLLAVIGTTPYIALQLQSLSLSFSVFGDINTATPGAIVNSPTPLVVALGLVAFTIMFGTRNLNASERHEGVVIAIAVEALVKLVALLTIGITVTFWLGYQDGPPLSEQIASFSAQHSINTSRWTVLMLLSSFAVVCLPRMFQVLVVENRDDHQLAVASWAFPTYLLAMCLFIVPIALFGLSNLPSTANPDLFVLTVPLSQGHDGLALLAFLGGFSSATAMVIVAALAVSTMMSNHIILPLWFWMSGMSVSANDDLRRVTLIGRRACIILIILLGYFYFRLTGGTDALAAIGLIAFLGVSQVMPALVGGLFWRFATRAGALAGTITGMVIWGFTSLLPGIEGGLSNAGPLMPNGLFGWQWLHPNALFGVSFSDPLVHAFFWSIGLNTLAFIAVSLMTRATALERFQEMVFSQSARNMTAPRTTPIEGDADQLLVLSQRVLGRKATNQIFKQAAQDQKVSGSLPNLTTSFIERLEREFAAVVGASTANAMISRVAGQREISVSALVAMADEAAQIVSYSARLQEKSDELERTAAELRVANMKLIQLGEQRDTFLSQVSHELRTPMTSIRSFSEILKDDAGADSQRGAYFASIINDESIRLTKLLDEILELSFLESGRIKIDISKCAVTDVINRAILATTSLTAETNAVITQTLHNPATLVETDADRLAQAVINLLTNAIKHNDKPTPEITIATQEIKVLNQGRLVISIADNGPGIAPQNRGLIFEKFASLSPGDASGGVGLGLPITKQIIENLNGELSFYSNDNGTVFKITLPLALTRADDTKN